MTELLLALWSYCVGTSAHRLLVVVGRRRRLGAVLERWASVGGSSVEPLALAKTPRDVRHAANKHGAPPIREEDVEEEAAMAEAAVNKSLRGMLPQSLTLTETRNGAARIEEEEDSDCSGPTMLFLWLPRDSTARSRRNVPGSKGTTGPSLLLVRQSPAEVREKPKQRMKDSLFSFSDEEALTAYFQW